MDWIRAEARRKQRNEKKWDRFSRSCVVVADKTLGLKKIRRFILFSHDYSDASVARFFLESCCLWCSTENSKVFIFTTGSTTYFWYCLKTLFYLLKPFLGLKVPLLYSISSVFIFMTKSSTIYKLHITTTIKDPFSFISPGFSEPMAPDNPTKESCYQ